MSYGGGALNRLKWLVYVLMLQWLWSWFVLIFRLSHIYTLLDLPHDVLISVLNGWFTTSGCNGCGAGLPSFPVSPIYALLSPSWYPHIPVFTTTCCIYYCYTDSCSILFPVENGGSSWNLWELAIGDRGQLEVKDEKENIPLVDMVAIVVEVYGVVCQNTTLAT